MHKLFALHHQTWKMSCVDKGRIYYEKLGKNGLKGLTFEYQRGIMVVMLKKIVFFALFAVLSQF